MAEKLILSIKDVRELVDGLAERIKINHPKATKIYGVPRGGVPVALALGRLGLYSTDHWQAADVIVDDLVDSGATMERLFKETEKPFYGLIDKRRSQTYHGKWVVFPWEGSSEGSIEDAFLRLIQYIGEDANRGGLVETPKRMAKAWAEWTSGYNKDPKEVLKCFEDGAETYDEAVVEKDIPFYSHCEHHMAPFFGTITISYIPERRIVGLSKLVRLVDIFAKRLQVQERLTAQIADALVDCLQPKGVGVIVTARHLCMESRGVCRQGQSTLTSALRGALYDNEKARAEFLALARP